MFKFLKSLLWPSVSSITSDLSDMVNALEAVRDRRAKKIEANNARIGESARKHEELMDKLDAESDAHFDEIERAHSVAQKIRGLLS